MGKISKNFLPPQPKTRWHVFSSQQMSQLCLSVRVIDLPMRSLLEVSAPNKAPNASSNASACLSNPNEFNSWRECSSSRRPTAAAAVHVRSHDGWGLVSRHGKWLVRSKVNEIGRISGEFRGKKKSEKKIPLTNWYSYVRQWMKKREQSCWYLTGVYASQMHLLQEICKEGPLPRLHLLSPASNRPIHIRIFFI